MKKLSAKRRAGDVQLTISLRKSSNRSVRENGKGVRRATFRKRQKRKKTLKNADWELTNIWIDAKCRESVDMEINRRQGVTIILPTKMNFSSDYESTTLCLGAVRRLVKQSPVPRQAYRLRMVDFSKLEEISSSAALVLTAELSRWEDSIHGKLKPFESTWFKDIYNSFYQIGFFDLFEQQPERELDKAPTPKPKFAKYLKGKNEKKLSRELRTRVQSIVGDSIDKWMFLRHGLDEAITNVTQHAYPDESKLNVRHQNWYMTGSYVESKKTLKIIFYDQGVGIPNSLPAWSLYESALKHLANLGITGLLKDEDLIKASIETRRSRTGKSDRGKGLTDMLDFIKERKNGYISVLSGRGLYKYSLCEGTESVKSVGFENEILGTIIIWCVALN